MNLVSNNKILSLLKRDIKLLRSKEKPKIYIRRKEPFKIVSSKKYPK